MKRNAPLQVISNYIGMAACIGRGPCEDVHDEDTAYYFFAELIKQKE